MATTTENLQTSEDNLRSTSLGNTIDNPKKTSARDKFKVFAITINEASMPHYEDIKDYISNLKMLEYMLVVEHFGQKHKHYHMLIKFNNAIRLSNKKMFGSHIEPDHKGFMNIYKYITCQDKKHKLKGVTFKIIDEIDKCGMFLKTKILENFDDNSGEPEPQENENDWQWITYNDDDDKYIDIEYNNQLIYNFIHNSNNTFEFYSLWGFALSKDALHGPLIYDYDGTFVTNPKKIIEHNTIVLKDRFTFEPYEI